MRTRAKHKEMCKCIVCKNKRNEPHIETCSCMACKMMRGETKRENNPFYGKKHTKENRLINKEKHLGKNNIRFKGRFRKKSGYILIYQSPEKHIAEHRLIMENSLKRKLSSQEQVHHINGNRGDNRIENLQLMKNWGEHVSIHNRLRKGIKMKPKHQSERYIPTQIICPVCDGSGLEGSVTGEDEGFPKCNECHGTGKVPCMLYDDKN